MKKNGGLFDFNHDGEVSFGEQALGMAAILGILPLQQDRFQHRSQCLLQGDD